MRFCSLAMVLGGTCYQSPPTDVEKVAQGSDCYGHRDRDRRRHTDIQVSFFEKNLTKGNYAHKNLGPFLLFLYSVMLFLCIHCLSVSPLSELRDMYCLSFFLIIFHQHYLNRDTGEIFSVFLI